MILNSQILNNKRILSSFSVQILSVFTFSHRLSIKLHFQIKDGWTNTNNLKKSRILYLICLFLQNPTVTRCGEEVRLKHYDGD